MPVVTQSRKEFSPSGTHRHIAGVCTTDGYYYTRAQVVAGLERGEVWLTYGGGQHARIKKIPRCASPGCSTAPYITSAPDHTPLNNLDNLPYC